MMAGHIAVLLRPVSFPVYQELQAATQAAYVQKPPNGIVRMVIDELRGWRGCCRRRQGTGVDRCW